jgi:hypothetical protein
MGDRAGIDASPGAATSRGATDLTPPVIGPPDRPEIEHRSKAGVIGPGSTWIGRGVA